MSGLAMAAAITVGDKNLFGQEGAASRLDDFVCSPAGCTFGHITSK